MASERNLADIPRSMWSTNDYCNSLKQFFKDPIDHTYATWRVHAFDGFWCQRDSLIGVIHTTKLDPNSAAGIIVRHILVEKLGPPGNVRIPGPAGYYHPPWSPIVRIVCRREDLHLSPEHNLASMIGQAGDAISYSIMGKSYIYNNTPADGTEELDRELEYRTAILRSFEYALERQSDSLSFPYEDNVTKMICLVIGIDLVMTAKTATEKTAQIVRMFIRILENIFVLKGKGKLVFVGNKNSDAIKCLRDANKVVQIYDDDDGSCHGSNAIFHEHRHTSP